MSNTTKAGRDPQEFAAMFGAIADAVRLRMVRLMASGGQALCVCELVDCLEEPQYAISRHLRELRECGLLEAQRDGRWMYYRLSGDEAAQQVGALVASLPAPGFAAEQRRFEERMRLRVEGRCRIGIQKAYLSSETETAETETAETETAETETAETETAETETAETETAETETAETEAASLSGLGAAPMLAGGAA